MSQQQDYKKCRDCIHYDPSPFPEYGGKLAKCRAVKRNPVGAGKIGWYTVASRECYEPKEGEEPT